MNEKQTTHLQDWEKFYEDRLAGHGYDAELAAKEIQTKEFTLAKWLAYYRMGLAKKGLFLYGKTGTGKTFHCKMIKKFFNLTLTSEAKLKQLRKYQDHEFGNYLRISHGYGIFDMIIDEFGGESELVSFGEKINIAIDTVNIRYDVYCDQKGLTIFTSNWGEEQIIEKFGDRVMSRLREMCTFVLVDGDDVRGSGLVSDDTPVSSAVQEALGLEVEERFEHESNPAGVVGFTGEK